jgi:hypothetical protein
MIPAIPWYLTSLVLAINVAVAIAVWRILSSAAGQSGLPPLAQRRFRIGAGLLLGGWLGAVLLFAPASASLFTAESSRLTPRIPVFAAGSIVAILVALRLSSTFRRVVAAASLPALVGVQVYRVIGFVFLLLLAAGQLPAHFALPAGWGDVAIGIAAPLVALALARGVRGAPALAIAWGVIGLLDLVVAVGMGTGYLAPLLAPDLGTRVPPAAAMGVFPMFVVPAFTVPLSVLLHLVALGRVVGASARTDPSPSLSIAGPTGAR